MNEQEYAKVVEDLKALYQEALDRGRLDLAARIKEALDQCEEPLR